MTKVSLMSQVLIIFVHLNFPRPQVAYSNYLFYMANNPNILNLPSQNDKDKAVQIVALLL